MKTLFMTLLLGTTLAYAGNDYTLKCQSPFGLGNFELKVAHNEATELHLPHSVNPDFYSFKKTRIVFDGPSLKVNVKAKCEWEEGYCPRVTAKLTKSADDGYMGKVVVRYREGILGITKAKSKTRDATCSII